MGLATIVIVITSLYAMVLTYAEQEEPVAIPRACSTAQLRQLPFCDPSLPKEARVKDLIKRLTLQEKLPLLIARQSPSNNVSRLGIPEYSWGANCIHGVQSRCSPGGRCPTSFPNPVGLGASMDRELWQAMGNVIGKELRALWLQGVGERSADNLPHLGLDCWSPNININRDPRWGRNMEVPSEDPLINGAFGASYSLGLQNGQDPRFLQAITTLKHYAAYSVEDYQGTTTRHNYNAIVSQHDLQATYLPAWRRSIVEGKAKGIMCSYNSVDGIPSCASPFLYHIIRDLWGFDGYSTSDTGAIEDIYNSISGHNFTSTPEEAVALALKAGTDIDSSFLHGRSSTGGEYLEYLPSAIIKGLVSERDVDKALYRTLGLRFDLGLFDPIEDQPYWHMDPHIVSSGPHRALNRRAARESLVLLQNPKKGDGEFILPFPRGRRVVVMGPHANASKALVGNYIGQICKEGLDDYSCVLTPFLALSKANHGGVTTLARGCTDVHCSTSALIPEAVEAAQDADLVVVVLGLDTSIEEESHDRLDIDLPGYQMELAEEIVALGKPTCLVVLNGGAVALEDVKGKGNLAILEAFYPSTEGSRAIAEVVCGDISPSGKLPYTMYPREWINQVDFLNMSMVTGPGRTYRYYQGNPIWPFGYGLTYSSININIGLPSSTTSAYTPTTPDSLITTFITVTNTGKRSVQEVVQVYVVPIRVAFSHQGPVINSQLIDFHRLNKALEVGESRELEFQYRAKEVLSLVDGLGNVVIAPGDYRLVWTNGVDASASVKLRWGGEEVVVESFPDYFMRFDGILKARKRP